MPMTSGRAIGATDGVNCCTAGVVYVLQHVDGPQAIRALSVPIFSAHRRAADSKVVWGHSGKLHFPANTG
ncbi:unnamed protein product [Arctogadus glacialis]